MKHDVCAGLNIKEELTQIFKEHFRKDNLQEDQPAEKKELKKEHLQTQEISI